MSGLNVLVYYCNDYENYYKVVIVDYLFIFAFIKECIKCKTKSPKCYRHNYISYKKEPGNKIIVIIFKCCNTTKAIMPSYLLGEKGIGAKKREGILEDLSNTNMLQKDIAKKHEVSEATISRIKKQYMSIKPESLISEIIQIDCDYPTSGLNNNNSDQLPLSRNIANYNYNLIAIYKTVQLKKVYADQQADSHLRQMSCLLYYKFQKEKIKIIIVKNV